MARLTEAIETGVRLDHVAAAPDGFITIVYRCDKNGLIRGDALYEREYKTLSDAQNGHKDVLELLSKGTLRATKAGQ